MSKKKNKKSAAAKAAAAAAAAASTSSPAPATPSPATGPPQNGASSSSPPPPPSSSKSPTPEPEPEVDSATKAERLKEQGNQLFKQKKYQEAINLYSQAIGAFLLRYSLGAQAITAGWRVLGPCQVFFQRRARSTSFTPLRCS
ncbi:hypothetical protein AURDEDRAFT_174457 [Auricularia subglabra TFB-10046 SS5]|uniref:TPR-like protein n=1 Tax=Auricularia subglabra (strain TFB-10046 / SS5) TaxID=717982 RepID=J0CYV0_AURST|nr:hypothetical protein AURDEDRAFT_174457 [Auricularia subglabra TFB-10046 SS5]